MNDREDIRLEEHLIETAAAFSYPETPELAGGSRRQQITGPLLPRSGRRIAWVLLVLLLLAAVLMAVPSVRAVVLDFFQIGAIKLLTTENLDMAAVEEGEWKEPRVQELAGATTWPAAKREARFPLRLPAVPTGLGMPDEVFLQQMDDPGLGDQAIIAVWYDEQEPGEVDLALYQISHSSYALKAAAEENMVETAVRGRPAYWIEGPHWLQFTGGEFREWLIVKGSSLVWAEQDITYRLEGADSMDEAMRIAESLR